MTRCHRCGSGMDPVARFCPSCGTPRGSESASAAARKHVVVMFVDIVGSTAIAERLDPEIVRDYLQEYFALASSVLWNVGGTVEKFVGDAVMAVFGVPLTREDDVRRALTAARELHRKVGELSESMHERYGVTIQIRIGIGAGEAYVTRHADGQFSVTGDVVNVAARLQQLAEPGETAVGELAAKLAGPGAPLHRDRQLEAKGKSEPITVWKLHPSEPFDAAGRTATRLVGREEELEDLLRFSRRAIERRDAALITVVGSVGVGKSRLVRELLTRLPGVQVLTASCATYGMGVAFSPLVAVLEQLDAPDWLAQVRMVLGDDPEAALVAERLVTAVGSSSGVTSLADIEWAVRRVFTALAEARPLAVVWDDLHAADPSFVELLAQMSRRLRGIPIIMIGVGRPELWDTAPDWGGGHRNSMTLELHGLPEQATRELIAEYIKALPDETLPGELAGVGAEPEVLGHLLAEVEPDRLDLEWILAMSEGNPLVVGELVQNPEIDESLPVQVLTMFDARLDRLAEDDRRFCQRAAVVGREFWLDAVAGADRSRSQLDRLHQLGIIVPIAQATPGRPTHRFADALMVDSAYRGTPKSRRMTWHADTADWIAHQAVLSDGVRAELVAAHLESAYELFREVRASDETVGDLPGRTGRACAVASDVCLDRGDLAAAIRYLDRANQLLAVTEPGRYGIAYRHFRCLLATGALIEAEQLLARTDVGWQDDPWWQSVREVAWAQVDLLAQRIGPDAAYQVGAAAAERLPSDCPPDLLLWTHELMAMSSAMQMQLAIAERETRRAIEAARAAGDRWSERRLLCGLCEVAFWGLTPVPQAITLCQRTLAIVDADLRSSVPVLAMLAALSALAGDPGQAKLLEERVRDIVGQLHLADLVPALRQYLGLCAFWSDRPADAAIEFGRAAEELGGPSSPVGATMLLMAARVRWLSGDVEAALAQLDWQDEIGPPPAPQADLQQQALWYGLAARVAAVRGDDRAVQWGMLAVEAARRCDDLRATADAWLDLATAYALRGERAEGRDAWTECDRLLAAKGIRSGAAINSANRPVSPFDEVTPPW